jgi:hypothetical protein
LELSRKTDVKPFDWLKKVLEVNPEYRVELTRSITPKPESIISHYTSNKDIFKRGSNTYLIGWIPFLVAKNLKEGRDTE